MGCVLVLVCHLLPVRPPPKKKKHELSIYSDNIYFFSATINHRLFIYCTKLSLRLLFCGMRYRTSRMTSTSCLSIGEVTDLFDRPNVMFWNVQNTYYKTYNHNYSVICVTKNAKTAYCCLQLNIKLTHSVYLFFQRYHSRGALPREG